MFLTGGASVANFRKLFLLKDLRSRPDHVPNKEGGLQNGGNFIGIRLISLFQSKLTVSSIMLSRISMKVRGPAMVQRFEIGLA